MTPEMEILLAVTIVIEIVIVVVVCKGWNSKKQQEFRAKHEEEVKRWEEQRYKEGKVIVEAKIIGTGDGSQGKYGLGGALAGGLIGGVPGAIVGAALPNGRSDQKIRFLVKYSDGRIVTKDCWPNGWEYKELIKYVKWEDV